MSEEKEIDLKDFKETKIINGIEYYSARELFVMLGYLDAGSFLKVVNKTIKFYTKKSKLDWLKDFIDDHIIINKDFIYSRCKVIIGDSKGWRYKYDYLLSAKGVNLCIQFSSHLKCTVKDSRIDIVNQLDKIHTSKFNNLTDVIRKNSDGTEYISARDFGELLGYYKFINYIPTLQYALEIWKSLKLNNQQQYISIGLQGNDETALLDFRDFDDLTKNVVRVNGDVIRTKEKVSCGANGGHQYKYDYHMSIDFAFHLLSYSDRTKPKFQELMGQLNNYRIKLEEQNKKLKQKISKKDDKGKEFNYALYNRDLETEFNKRFASICKEFGAKIDTDYQASHNALYKGIYGIDKASLCTDKNLKANAEYLNLNCWIEKNVVVMAKITALRCFEEERHKLNIVDLHVFLIYFYKKLEELTKPYRDTFLTNKLSGKVLKPTPRAEREKKLKEQGMTLDDIIGIDMPKIH